VHICSLFFFFFVYFFFLVGPERRGLVPLRAEEEGGRGRV
jgi:hypothetical protein